AGSIRRAMRKESGDSPIAAWNWRLRWPADMCSSRREPRRSAVGRIHGRCGHGPAAERPAAVSSRIDALAQRPAAEEVRVADRLDDHDGRTEEEHPDAEDEDESDAEDRRARTVVGVERIDRGGDEDDQQGHSPDQREQEPEEERASRSEQGAAEVPDAG